MTQRLYRICLVTTALVWLQVGMRLDHAATIKDTGGTPEVSELLLLAMLTIWGAAGIVALWKHPAAGQRFESKMPAA